MGSHSQPAARRRGVFSRLSTLVFVSFVAVASAANIDPRDVSAPSPEQIFTRDDKKPTDFGWVKKWAAIGDSFTAGIGSGHQLGSAVMLDRAWKCSRYDYSWPQIVNQALGSSVQKFQFEACSGDRSGGIYDQVDLIDSGLDLVMMTAGGNDLCLAGMIKTCVIMPFDGEDACQAIIDKAQENIDTILKPNLHQILDKLDGKIRKDGVLIYSGYAPFFNTENEDCATKQEWAIKAWKWWQFWKWLTPSLTLTVDRRKKFNTLVGNINKAIKEVVTEFDKDRDIGYRATFSDWSSWPKISGGEFCDPDSTGRYPDPEQPDLMFIKFGTTGWEVPPHDQLKRRELANESTTTSPVNEPPVIPEAEQPDETTRRAMDEYAKQLRGRLTREHIYNSLLYRSVNPRAEALHRLNPRAPEPPGCPGDGTPGMPFGLGVPDAFGSIFHPNQKGHEVIAAYALQNLVYTRADILGVDDGSCAATRDDFRCHQKDGKKAFVSWDRLNENYKDFCDSVKQPDNEVNWKFEKTYHAESFDEHTFKIQLRDGASKFDKQQCLDSMDRIINSCDGNDPNNPLNFKFGGKWVRGSYDYQINPRYDRKMFTKKDGVCEGWWKVFFTSYRFYGRGWAGHDWGQKTLLSSARSCGAAVTGWSFHYCLPGGKHNDCGEYEWVSEFNTPVYFAIGCFRNNWVAHKAGGETYEKTGSTKLGCGGPNA
ncbi:SGNH hydrolase-type esterase domain-containing protein [Echria macrotheca]|uniref:SGNH hydrolase-type esterase domain-containing protein n=1 Tax=Echria macrotheca TaxID=438768 RepID=A0AAJ0F986_9PEZI|nr:SGNH hydrolase-type esterase domain-containing protein [Echria macrotheca]